MSSGALQRRYEIIAARELRFPTPNHPHSHRVQSQARAADSGFAVTLHGSFACMRRQGRLVFYINLPWNAYLVEHEANPKTPRYIRVSIIHIHLTLMGDFDMSQ